VLFFRRATLPILKYKGSIGVTAAKDVGNCLLMHSLAQRELYLPRYFTSSPMALRLGTAQFTPWLLPALIFQTAWAGALCELRRSMRRSLRILLGARLVLQAYLRQVGISDVLVRSLGNRKKAPKHRFLFLENLWPPEFLFIPLEARVSHLRQLIRPVQELIHQIRERLRAIEVTRDIASDPSIKTLASIAGRCHRGLHAAPSNDRLATLGQDDFRSRRASRTASAIAV
jgi:hypothetical protein